MIGGLAMQAWGASRFTKDADIAVDLGVRERVLAFTQSLGYETLFVSDGYSNPGPRRHHVRVWRNGRIAVHHGVRKADAGMDPHEYLEFLNQFSKMHPSDRETSEGWPPFEL